MQSEGSMDLNDKKQKIIPQIWHGIWVLLFIRYFIKLWNNKNTMNTLCIIKKRPGEVIMTRVQHNFIMQAVCILYRCDLNGNKCLFLRLCTPISNTIKYEISFLSTYFTSNWSGKGNWQKWHQTILFVLVDSWSCYSNTTYI